MFKIGSLVASLAVVIAGLTVLTSNVFAAGQRAAGVDYELTARPATLRPEHQPASDADIKYLNVTTMDSNRVMAALQQPRFKPVSDSVLIIDVHTSGDTHAKIF
jgi:hypothetical protein